MYMIISMNNHYYNKWSKHFDYFQYGTFFDTLEEATLCYNQLTLHSTSHIYKINFEKVDPCK